MLVNPHLSPICPRCGGSVMSPVAWPAVTLGAAVFLICCPSCGAAMGSIRREEGAWEEEEDADADTLLVPPAVDGAAHSG